MAPRSLHKHGTWFELAAAVFSDPRALTVADLEYGEEAQSACFSKSAASPTPTL